MAVEPSHAARKFLVDIFGASTACPIFIASLANSDAKKDARREGPRDVITRSVPVIEGFVQRWDLAGRSTYFCVSTLRRDAQTRSKATLAGSTAVNASAFYYDYKDYQAFAQVGVIQTVVNLNARELGVELEVFSRPLRGLFLKFATSWLDTRVRNVLLPDAVSVVDHDLPQAPRWSS